MELMDIKAETVAEFLARGGAITDGGSTMKRARSLRAMRREDEQRAIDETGDREVKEREDLVRERLAEIFG